VEPWVDFFAEMRGVLVRHEARLQGKQLVQAAYSLGIGAME
jgi:hypothetical protein